jgi:SOS response regulatory protein OraA/RecX
VGRPETQKKTDALTTLRVALRRPLSEREAEGFLVQSGFARDEIDAALQQAREFAWIGDHIFARMWVEDRLLHHPLSRRAVEEELRGRKVAHDVAAAALEEHYPVEREREIAQDLARTRLARLAGVDEAARLRRTTDFLIRRGFSASVAIDSARRALRGGDHD